VDGEFLVLKMVIGLVLVAHRIGHSMGLLKVFNIP